LLFRVGRHLEILWLLQVTNEFLRLVAACIGLGDAARKFDIALRRERPRIGWQDWADPVLQKPYEIRDGLLHIPDVPGVGLEWNEEAVAASQANL
jgi:L-alanine-DL-glutamate epimerase-like enolase superfamily enzyme